MKTYCKKVNITDLDFIKEAIKHCLDGKWHKRKVIRFIASYEKMKREEVEEILDIFGKDKFDFFIDHLARYMQSCIIERKIVVPKITFSQRYDDNSCKWREIGVESMLQQCYEYVAVDACMEMFKKKIGRYQCASIPKRGQIYGMKALSRWLKNDVSGTKYFVKLDVQKCYPSIQQSMIKQFLHRDIKNDNLLYLLDTMIDTFVKGGLSIGSHLSQWLCNYYLSYAYHFMDQELFIQRRGKRVRLISHDLFYMDDIILFSGNKKHLAQAVEMIIDYFDKNLGLVIKPKWNIRRMLFTDKHQRQRGCFIDMMGFKIYRDHVTIRKSIALKINRKANRVRKKIKNHKPITQKDAFQISSYNGWLVNTHSGKMARKHEMPLCLSKCRRITSQRMRIDNQNFVYYQLILEVEKRDYYERMLQNHCSDRH